MLVKIVISRLEDTFTSSITLILIMFHLPTNEGYFGAMTTKLINDISKQMMKLHEIE